VRTDVPEERIASIIRVKIISELGTTLTVTSNLRSVLQLLLTVNVVHNSLDYFHPDDRGVTFLRNVDSYTRRHIPEDDIRKRYRCYFVIVSLAYVISALVIAFVFV
jgi:hypothetical protein